MSIALQVVERKTQIIKWRPLSRVCTHRSIQHFMLITRQQAARKTLLSDNEPTVFVKRHENRQLNSAIR